ncbi:MAG: gliding motility-associated transporter ATP-binding subunit GldA [Bacteroidota bacterium]
MSVVVKNLVKTFGTQNAVDNISFSANKGSILGFLGPNGAGKSTTMKIATCYLPPSAGTIEVCGFDVNTHPMEVRRLIGYLPEHNPLYLDMYVLEYLEFIASLHQLNKGEITTRIHQMIDQCGLGKEQAKKIGELSKGYRQRVGLAQALIHNPEVLILDEPTTGLDPNQLTEIRNLIKEIGREKTVIFSTHIMQEVEQICDKVVIINRGKIVANEDVKYLQNFRGKLVRISLQLSAYLDPALIQNLEGVTKVESLGNNKYMIEAGTQIDIRPSLFQLTTTQQASILEMKQEEDSLEKVFKELTL